MALTAWWFAGDNVLEASTSGERAGSTHAFLYFAGCLGAFACGAVVAGLAWPRRRATTLSIANYPGLPAAATVTAAATLGGGAVWFVRIVLAVGSPQVLLDLFLSGSSIADLKTGVFIPAQLPPFTTIVHLTPAAASMLLIQRKLSGWSAPQWLLMAGLVLLAGTRTLLLAERLAGLGLLAAIAVTLLFTAERIHTRRVVLAALASAGLLWFVWSAGEFTRSWMDSRDGDSTRLTVSNFRASLSYSQQRLGAYLFTAVNNGVIIVDEWPRQEFPANFAPVLGRAGVGGGREGAAELYDSELSREFTGESMPGRFYLDARDFGVILALGYGLVFGLAWRSAVMRSAVGIVVYATLMHVLLDSYRSAYLFDLQGAAAFAGAGIVILGSAGMCSQRRLVSAPSAVAPRMRAAPEHGLD